MQEFKGYGDPNPFEVDAKTKSRRRVAVLSIASVVLIAIIVSVSVAAVRAQLGGKKGHTDTSNIATSSAINATCAATLYPETCVSSLSSYPGASEAGPKDLVGIAVAVAMDGAEQALSVVSDLRQGSNVDTYQQLELENCQDFLGDTIEQLNSSLLELKNLDVESLKQPYGDVKTWLSASLTDLDTCLDGLPPQPTSNDVETRVQSTVLNLTELVSNSLAIVNKIADVLTNLNISIPTRRLLSSRGDFPAWVSAADRKLLKSDELKPDVIVAVDGSGDYRSIQDAVNAAPIKSKVRFVIKVKAGVYEEYVQVSKNKTMLMMVGDGMDSTIVTGSKNVIDDTTIRTFGTATFAAVGNGFIAKDMQFRNTAGPSKHQAVALRVSSDKSIFVGCKICAYQDTLYVYKQRQYFGDCWVSGTVDFIFGNAAVVLQKCSIVARLPGANQENTITAQGRTDPNQNTGISIHNCTITGETDLIPVKSNFPTYLGRPWKAYSRTVFMQSEMDDIIDQAGWLAWDGNFALDTLFYGEYDNSGPGANTANRVNWPGLKTIISKDEAQKYTVEELIGSSWVEEARVDHTNGLTE
ncbi:hypothetical protein KI387_009923 [Taxus chinensis]|uniref:Pectinesterase n=1 Tax=Taxus chinensis TaxID=29808 RepID=A0AA38FK95_TAXCH|nr:hypothetical protein KI387_009923 [Taxus chinensis]